MRRDRHEASQCACPSQCQSNPFCHLPMSSDHPFFHWTYFALCFLRCLSGLIRSAIPPRPVAGRDGAPSAASSDLGSTPPTTRTSWRSTPPGASSWRDTSRAPPDPPPKQPNLVTPNEPPASPTGPTPHADRTACSRWPIGEKTEDKNVSVLCSLLPQQPQRVCVTVLLCP